MSVYWIAILITLRGVKVIKYYNYYRGYNRVLFFQGF